MADPKPDVLVVGAGPVGLTAANLLVRHGLSVRIVDQKDGPSLESRALAVHARTLELCERLGLADRLVAVGLPLRAINVFADREPLGRLEVEIADTRYPFLLSLPQSDTERQLIACLESQGVGVEWNTRLATLDARADKVVATLESQSDRQQLEVPWVLGCDGAHSVVRGQMGVSFAGTREREQFFLADVKVRDGEVRPQACAFLSSEGTLALLPLPGSQTVRIVAPLLQEPLAGDTTLSIEEMEQLIFVRSGRRMQLDESIWQSTFTVSRRIVDRYRAGRVFLLGDAAHIHSPVGGQGMNVGMQDAFNLIWKLALVHKGRASAALLDSYDGERRPIGQRTLQSTRFATRIVVTHNALARAVRNILIRRFLRFGWLRRRAIRALTMLDVNYRDSAIVDDPALQRRRLPGWPPADGHRPQRVYAGDRAGDFEIADLAAASPHVRLFELLRSPRHVLLWFLENPAADDSTTRELTALSEAYCDVCETQVIVSGSAGLARQIPWPTWLDASGDGFEQYCHGGGRLVLIRPDGYVGWRGGQADIKKLGLFLARMFTSGRS